MAAVSVPPGRSLFGKVRETLTARRPARPGRPAALAAAMAKAREHVVTVAALGAFDLGAFQVHIPHLGAAPGWAALGISLLLADFAVRG